MTLLPIFLHCPFLLVLVFPSSVSLLVLYCGNLSKVLSYASPSVQKLHLCSDITSQLYKPAFYSSHLSRNIFYKWCCNHPGIPSSMAEILLFDLVFYNRVTPVSVSILKSLLGIMKAIPLKPQASSIVGTHI